MSNTNIAIGEWITIAREIIDIDGENRSPLANLLELRLSVYS